MGQNSGPFLRGQRGIYYCWIHGKLRSLRTTKPRLAKARHDALRESWRERQEREAAPAEWTVRRCFAYYLRHIRQKGHETARKRRRELVSLARFLGRKAIWRELSADRVEAWADTHPHWRASTRRSALNYVTAAMNHCARRGKIPESPIKGLKKPRWERRKAVAGEDDLAALLDAATGPFRAILRVLALTGARSGELCAARIEDYRDGAITLSEHKTDETGEDRVIYLNGEARQVVEGCIGVRTSGPIFLNTRGKPWTTDTLRGRFTQYRRKLGLGKGVCPYALRHAFTGRLINDANANPALVAKALGHRGLEQLMRHYYREDPEAVRKMLDG